MRRAILIALAAILAGPVTAEQPPEVQFIPDACKNTPMAKVSKEFALNFNAATSAYGVGDYAGSLQAIARARPHAASGIEWSAIAQMEVAVLLGQNQTEVALPLLRAVVDDPCIGSAARIRFQRILAEKEAELSR